MREAMMKFKKVLEKKRGNLKAVIALGAMAAMLSGCVVYPAGYGHPYYAPAVYAPPVVVGVGGGWGWHGGWGRGGYWR